MQPNSRTFTISRSRRPDRGPTGKKPRVWGFAPFMHRTEMPPAVDHLIIGCGYLGRRVAARWLAAGQTVAALTRSNAETLTQLGIVPVVGDVLQPERLSKLPNAKSVLYAVGYDRSADADKRSVYVDGLANVLAALAGRYNRFVYASSTSVYGATTEPVIEDTPPDPQTDGGRICLDAERTLRDAEPAATILRYAGLYGPDRVLTKTAALREAAPLAGSGDEHLNLIHIDDAALVADLASTHAAPDLLLVSDRSPVERRAYYTLLASLVDAAPPTFNGQPRAGRPLSDRECRSDRLHAWLAENNASLTFPTFREGLPDAVERSSF